MKLLVGLPIACVLVAPFELEAQERGRIKWKSPTQAEADRLASESAMSDNILRNGDIVVTDRGFFMFQSYTADGATRIFVPVPNPMAAKKAVGGR
jgi:hypothetical protein